MIFFIFFLASEGATTTGRDLLRLRVTHTVPEALFLSYICRRRSFVYSFVDDSGGEGGGLDVCVQVGGEEGEWGMGDSVRVASISFSSLASKGKLFASETGRQSRERQVTRVCVRPALYEGTRRYDEASVGAYLCELREEAVIFEEHGCSVVCPPA